MNQVPAGTGMCLLADSKPSQLNNLELLTVSEAAAVRRVSDDTVRRMYRHRRGVLKLGHPETISRRAYFSLRIPAQIIKADIVRMSGELQSRWPG